MASCESPRWVASATAAAGRLAAEAGAEVDEVLAFGDASSHRLGNQIVRLQQSADISEVATDLAVLLWAECEDVPPIATILEEPETQAALHTVADARHQAAARLAAGRQTAGAPGRTPARPRDVLEPVEGHEEVPAHAAEAGAASLAPTRDTAPPSGPVPAPHLATARSAVPVRRHGTGTGAVLAGAAAVIVVFGRRLRRA